MIIIRESGKVEILRPVIRVNGKILAPVVTNEDYPEVQEALHSSELVKWDDIKSWLDVLAGLSALMLAVEFAEHFIPGFREVIDLVAQPIIGG